MPKLTPLAFLLILVLPIFSRGDTKSFAYDFEAWPEGRPPKDVFVVDGTVTIKSNNGNKVLEIGADPIVDAIALLGSASTGNASIEAKVLATKTGRSYPRFGIGVHGQSGFRLVVFPAKKELQLTRNEEVLETAPFTWTPDAWLKLKLRATKENDGKWTIIGKAWAADAAEPAEPLLKHVDTKYRGQGKCSIMATPYSGTPIDFDDVKIEIAG